MEVFCFFLRQNCLVLSRKYSGGLSTQSLVFVLQLLLQQSPLSGSVVTLAFSFLFENKCFSRRLHKGPSEQDKTDEACLYFINRTLLGTKWNYRVIVLLFHCQPLFSLSETVDFSWQEPFLFLCAKDALGVSSYCASRAVVVLGYVEGLYAMPLWFSQSLQVDFLILFCLPQVLLKFRCYWNYTWLSKLSCVCVSAS